MNFHQKLFGVLLKVFIIADCVILGLAVNPDDTFAKQRLLVQCKCHCNIWFSVGTNYYKFFPVVNGIF